MKDVHSIIQPLSLSQESVLFFVLIPDSSWVNLETKVNSDFLWNQTYDSLYGSESACPYAIMAANIFKYAVAKYTKYENALYYDWDLGSQSHMMNCLGLQEYSQGRRHHRGSWEPRESGTAGKVGP